MKNFEFVWRSENLLARLMLNHINLIKYGIIGVVGLVIDFLLFYLLVSIFSIHYLIANILSILLAITHNYLLNAFFNFKVKDKFFKRYLLYLSFGMIGMVISSAGLYLLVEYMHLNELISKSIVLIIVTFSQYLLNKKITFRHG